MAIIMGTLAALGKVASVVAKGVAKAITKTFSVVAKTTFKQATRVATRNLSSSSPLRNLLLRVNKSNLFGRGANFSNLSPLKKLSLAKTIRSYAREARGMKQMMQKDPRKYAKELNAFKTTQLTSRLTDMNRGIRSFLCRDIGNQYEKKSNFKQEMLIGLTVSNLTNIFVKNEKHSFAKTALIEPVKLIKLSMSKLGKVVDMMAELDNGKKQEHGMNMTK